MIDTWGQVLSASFQQVWTGVITFIPNLIVALIIFIVGWIIGMIIGKIVEQIIKSLKLDHALRNTGIEDVLRRGGINLNTGAFVGGLVKWFVIVVFLIASLDVLRLEMVNSFLSQVVLGYIPQVIIAVLILLVGAVVADVMRKVVSGSAAAAEVRHANFLGLITKWAIWIFTILTALFQLGIAPALIQTLFMGVVVALSLAVGLSFGLGGQDAAREIIQRTREEMSHRK